jgi:hypothetical protein
MEERNGNGNGATFASSGMPPSIDIGYSLASYARNASHRPVSDATDFDHDVNLSYAADNAASLSKTER